jgi:hypothetical protein
MKAATVSASRKSKSTSNTDANVLLKTLISFKQGDFSVRMPVDLTGVEYFERNFRAEPADGE